MNIRGIRKDHINRIIDILNRNYDEVMIKEHSKDVLKKFKEHNTIEAWENQMKWKNIFVVEDGEEIIATGALANFGDSDLPKYCISNFFVEHKKQSMGIGKLLFQFIFDTAKGKGISCLHVPSSRNGFEFYKKMGFVKDCIQDDEKDEITWMTMIIS